MALSEYEQKMLAELEAQLTDEDPKLAESFRPAPSTHIGIKNLIIGIFIALAGLGIVIAGVATTMTWLGVIGFAIMVVGVVYIVSGKEDAPTSGGAAPERPKAPSTGKSFMDRQAELWEKRRDKGFGG